MPATIWLPESHWNPQPHCRQRFLLLLLQRRSQTARITVMKSYMALPATPTTLYHDREKESNWNLGDIICLLTCVTHEDIIKERLGLMSSVQRLQMFSSIDGFPLGLMERCGGDCGVGCVPTQCLGTAIAVCPLYSLSALLSLPGSSPAPWCSLFMSFVAGMVVAQINLCTALPSWFLFLCSFPLLSVLKKFLFTYFERVTRKRER